MNHKKYDISVIIPMYNIGDYLYKCIKSLNDQSFKNFDVVFINDGSTDNTLTLFNSLIEKYNFPFKLLSTDNNGVASARNTALEAANGEYIVFIDADDYYETDYLANLYECITIHDADCAICGYTKVSEKHIKLKESVLPEKRLLKKTNNQTVLEKTEIFKYDTQIWCSIIKKDIIIQNNIRFTDGCCYGEDSEFMQKILLNVNCIAHTGLRSYYYVTRNSSSTKKSVGIKRLDSLFAFKRIISYININGIKFDRRILNKMYFRKIIYLINSYIKERNHRLYYQLINDNENKKIIMKELEDIKSGKQKINIFMILKVPKLYYIMYSLLYSSYSFLFLRTRVNL